MVPSAEFLPSSLLCFSPPLLIPSDSLKLLLNSLFDFADMSPWRLCGRNMTALLVLAPTDEFRNQCWHLTGVRINIAQVSRRVGKLIFRRWTSSSWESLSVFTPGWCCSTHRYSWQVSSSSRYEALGQNSQCDRVERGANWCFLWTKMGLLFPRTCNQSFLFLFLWACNSSSPKSNANIV